MTTWRAPRRFQTPPEQAEMRARVEGTRFGRLPKPVASARLCLSHSCARQNERAHAFSPEVNKLTVALYISPRADFGNGPTPIPVLFADILISRAEPIPNGIVALPGAVEPNDIHGPQNTRLGRKVRIVDQTVIACAGCGARIDNLHNDIRHRLPEWFATGHPSRAIAEQADLYRRTYGQPLEAIGTSYLGQHFNDLNCLGSIENVTFGWTCAIGSGREELLRRLALAEPDFAHAAATNPYGAIHAFAASLNAQILMEDQIQAIAPNAAAHIPTWGGYLEYVWFDHRTLSWSRGPKSLTFLYVFLNTGNNEYILERVSRTVAYEPGEDHGAILAMSTAGTVHCPIPEGLPQIELTECEVRDFWTAWHPELVTVAIAVENDANNIAVISIPNNEMQGVISSPGEMQFGLSATLTNKIGRYLAARLAVEYRDVPAVDAPG